MNASTPTSGTSILGTAVVRREDDGLLRGAGGFVANRAIPGCLSATFVRSTVAHATITELDVSGAVDMPGVVAVYTGADMPAEHYPAALPFFADEYLQPMLARSTVHFVGDPIVMIVAEDAYRAADAAEQVVVDYDFLPAVVDMDSALTDETLAISAAPSNVVMPMKAPEPTVDFSNCEVVVSEVVANQRIAVASLEGRAAAAEWSDGRLTFHASTQGTHNFRTKLAELLDLDAERIRVICDDVGGGFGAKGVLSLEEFLVAWAARALERPVGWIESRTENLLGMPHGRGQSQTVTIGGSRDGDIQAYHLDLVQDAGAYPHYGSLLPSFTKMMFTGVYEVDSSQFDSTSVITNTTPVGAFRGAGRPEATAAIERAVDLFAAEIDMDPADVRRRNFIDDNAFPHPTPGGVTYDIGAYETSLDLALAEADYAGLRTEQAARREAGDDRLLGIGLATYVEITAPSAGTEYGSTELRPDGTVLAKTGSDPFGQGHLTTWAMLISDRLGIDMDRIEVVHGDTDVVPAGGGTGGSRSVQLAGSSIANAAEHLADAARAVAADLLEAAVDDVVHDPASGTFHVQGTPAISKDWEAVAAAMPEPLIGLSDFEQERATFPFGTHVAVVEVDADTGAVELRRFVAVDDAGTIINPLLASGQIHGGLAQGIAQALYEQVVYDNDGNPLTTNFADYTIFSAAEMPMFDRVTMETPTPLNPLGAKGIGESGTVGATPAVQNAVIDALAHLGVRHLDIPLTPEKVWRAIQA